MYSKRFCQSLGGLTAADEKIVEKVLVNRIKQKSNKKETY